MSENLRGWCTIIHRQANLYFKFRFCLQIEFPEIEEGGKPRHRFMSAWEQRKEAWDSKYQYLLFAAEPYEVISFKVPNIEVDRNEKFFSHW